MQSIVRHDQQTFRNSSTYLLAMLFIVGNVALPQAFHLIPHGGPIWLPIYFFTLVGAWAYGWRVGLLTALLSPLVNAVLFGMPAVAALPAIILKSSLLAGAAGYAAVRTDRVSVPALAAVVLVYQTLGTLGEWVLTSSFQVACQDFRIGLPGMGLQIFGGYILLRTLRR